MSFNVNLAGSSGVNVRPNFGMPPSDGGAQQQPGAGNSMVKQYALKFGGFGCAVMFTVLGFIVAISPLDPFCILGGILQIIFGLLLMAVEAPLCYSCCPKWEFVGRYEKFVSSKPLIVRSVVYVIFGIALIVLCRQWGAIVGTVSLWVLAGYYASFWWQQRKAGGATNNEGQQDGLVSAENPNAMQQPMSGAAAGGYQPMPSGNVGGGGYQPYSPSY